MYHKERNRIGFFHIPKTAGLYINKAVSEYLNIIDYSIHEVIEGGEGGRLKTPSPHDDPLRHQIFLTESRRIENSILKERQWYSGHLSYRSMNLLDRNFLFTYLVNPYKRALSLYRYSIFKQETSKRFDRWILENFAYSLIRQLEGVQENPRVENISKKAEELLAPLQRVIVSDNPDTVLDYLNRRFDWNIQKIPPVNSFEEVQTRFPSSTIPKQRYKCEEIIRLMREAIQLDREIIEIALRFYPDTFSIADSWDDDTEVLELIRKYDFLEIH